MVCVVTGAASGIGRSIALRFASEGAVIFAADLNVAGCESTVADITKAGGKAEFVRVNVTSAADVKNLATTVQSRAAKLDVVVNCAGVFVNASPIEEVEEEVWDRVFSVNVKSMFLTAKYLVPLMKQSGGGSIINIASTAGFHPGPFRPAYMSSKGAVISLSRALAVELASANIRVNYIAPGVTDTPLAHQFSDSERQMIVGTSAMGRLIPPQEIANAALFLASSESTFHTGAGITVDGGLSI
jgi:NAD(P)-dependent dehydrogenase (short-subunit alcohol dehydrogenase family)